MRTISGSPCLHYDCSNRNSFGYCKTTVCINEHYRQEQWGLPSTTNKSESVAIKQQTNADRIRAMTDEELAEYLCKAIRDGVMMIFPGAHYSKDDIAELNQDWLDWLKEETTYG